MRKEKFQQNVQSLGRFLSAMVMPNIGAFIAWGLITAFFIPTGWTPNESLGSLVDPMINFLLPLLIGYTGGKIVAGTRGGVLGSIATIGIIVGVDIPMFIGAMLMGPLSGYLIKKVDEVFEGRIPAGFEMLVNNFSAGIVGALLAITAYQAIGPVVLGLNNILKVGVETIVNAGLLPLTSLFIEPGKILFLNNAINHGILGPLGIQEVNEIGRSIFFLLETNPGPGLGILLAYWTFSKGTVKQSSPGAIIIHFLGGIHEIYFPYVLMKPKLVLAVIAGGISGVFTFNLFGAGLVATPSPGSIFALIAMTPRGGWFPILLGVSVSAAVSFLISSVFIKRSAEIEDEDELRTAKEKNRVFFQTPAYDLLIERVRRMNKQTEESTNSGEESEKIKELPVLKKENIRLNLDSVSRDQAIRMAGQLLVDGGYVKEDYIDAMLEREKELTTYVGQGVAIPHGVGAAKKKIKKTGISILQFPQGIAFEEGTAYLVIGIAGLGNEHLKILANLSELVENTEMAKKLWETDDSNYIYELFTV